jgi:hypothetical protein
MVDAGTTRVHTLTSPNVEALTTRAVPGAISEYGSRVGIRAAGQQQLDEGGLHESAHVEAFERKVKWRSAVLR